MTAALPTDLLSIRLRPLADRLTPDEAMAYATAINETPSVLADPRLADAVLAAIYTAPVPCLLLRWADGSMGFAWFHPGRHVADIVTAAYDTARNALEAFHLQHAMPDGPAWRN